LLSARITQHERVNERQVRRLVTNDLQEGLCVAAGGHNAEICLGGQNAFYAAQHHRMAVCDNHTDTTQHRALPLATSIILTYLGPDLHGRRYSTNSSGHLWVPVQSLPRRTRHRGQVVHESWREDTG